MRIIGVKYLADRKIIVTLHTKAVGRWPLIGNRVRVPDSPAAVSLNKAQAEYRHAAGRRGDLRVLKAAKPLVGSDREGESDAETSPKTCLLLSADAWCARVM